MSNFLAIFELLFVLLGLPILILAVPVAFQAILSQKKRDYRLGFILPGVFLLLSVILLIVFIIKDNTLQYQSLGENLITIFARFFIYSIPTLILISVYFICRAKSKALKALIIAFIIAILPMRLTANDGGSNVYQAMLYRITFIHRFDDMEPSGYKTGTNVHLFPVYFLNEPY